MRLFLWHVAFLAAMLGPACGGRETSSEATEVLSPSMFYTVVGRITENSPTADVVIAGARVEIAAGASLQRVATAGANGDYRLDSVTGRVRLEVTADGYTTQIVDVQPVGPMVRVDTRLNPTPRMVRQDLSFGPDVPPSLFRAVHNAGLITISRVYPRYPTSTWPIPILTIEVWRGADQVASGNAFAYENFGDYAVPLRVAVDGGAVYEIRFRGTNYSGVYQTTMTVESPN